jgi:hypothetical protein
MLTLKSEEGDGCRFAAIHICVHTAHANLNCAVIKYFFIIEYRYCAYACAVSLSHAVLRM